MSTVPHLLHPLPVTIESISTEGNNVTFYVTEPLPTGCPNCLSPLFTKSGNSDDRLYRDEPLRDQHVTINLKRNRYKCKACNRLFRATIPGLDTRRRVTTRLIEHLEAHFHKRSNVELAEETGLLEKTVREIRKEFYDRLFAERQTVTPKVLGIDELYKNGEYLCLLTDLENHTLVELHIGREKERVVQYLRALHSPKDVQIICIDMYSPIRNACRTALPHAKLIVDKFHVMKLINDKFTDALKSLKRDPLKSLSRKDTTWLKTTYTRLEPAAQRRVDTLLQGDKKLNLTHQAKERFYSLYSAPDRAHAGAILDDWLKFVADQHLSEWHRTADTIRDWRDPILNFFDTSPPITNAFTENMVQKIKALNTKAKGLDFETLRAKALFECVPKTRAVKRPRINPFASRPAGFSAGFSIPPYDEVIENLGIPLHELFRVWLKDSNVPNLPEKSKSCV